MEKFQDCVVKITTKLNHIKYNHFYYFTFLVITSGIIKLFHLSD